MPSSSEAVTSSRFKARLPQGQLWHIFRVAFNSDAAAARFLGVSKTAIWRWCHDRSPLPDWVAKKLAEAVHQKVEAAHAAEQGLKWFLDTRRPPLPRKLSGCCAGFKRRV
jgi:hypothetical protein